MYSSKCDPERRSGPDWWSRSGTADDDDEDGEDDGDDDDESDDVDAEVAEVDTVVDVQNR